MIKVGQNYCCYCMLPHLFKVDREKNKSQFMELRILKTIQPRIVSKKQMACYRLDTYYHNRLKLPKS